MELMNDLEFFPVVAFKVTKACRMNCKFCCETNAKNIVLDLDRSKKIVDILIKNNIKRLCFSGGEPLLFPYLEELLIMSHNNGIENIVLSEDGKLLQKINISPKYIDKLRISIHGMKNVHDSITRVPGSFKDLKKCLKKITNIYNMSVTFVVTPENKNDIENVIKFVINNNIKTIYFANLLKSGAGFDYINKNGRIPSEDFKKIFFNVKEKYGDRLNIIMHPFEYDASCIVVYGNGDIYVEPYKNGKNENYQKFIGNILLESPKEIFEKFKTNKELWHDYCSRLKDSTIYKTLD